MEYAIFTFHKIKRQENGVKYRFPEINSWILETDI